MVSLVMIITLDVVGSVDTNGMLDFDLKINTVFLLNFLRGSFMMKSKDPHLFLWKKLFTPL
ncbi:hypothetical protein AB669_18435 [Pedobacter sp. BMA]|nr:hypothetical protein AB669_18435 [Pedobacter sp. BMA]